MNVILSLLLGIAMIIAVDELSAKFDGLNILIF